MSTREIGQAAEEFFPQNKLRKSFVVQNENTTATCFVKKESRNALTVSATDHDHRLARETSLAVNLINDGKEETQGRWTIISDAANTRISFFETEDIRR